VVVPVFPPHRRGQVVKARLANVALTSVWAVLPIPQGILLWLGGLLQAALSFGLVTSGLYRSADVLLKGVFLLPVRLVVGLYRALAPPGQGSPERLAKVLPLDLFRAVTGDWGSWLLAIPDLSRVYQVLGPEAHGMASCSSLQSFRRAWLDAMDSGRSAILDRVTEMVACGRCGESLPVVRLGKVEGYRAVGQDALRRFRVVGECSVCSGRVCPDCAVAPAAPCPLCHADPSSSVWTYWVHRDAVGVDLCPSASVASEVTDGSCMVSTDLAADVVFPVLERVATRRKTPYCIRVAHRAVEVGGRWWLMSAPAVRT
jgi:hypothetical protein